MTAPWIKLSEASERLGFRKMFKRLFRLPDGPELEFVVKDEGETVCVLAMTSGGAVILAEQFRPGPEKILRELPGGGRESGESFHQAASRELLEETGYVGDLVHVGQQYRCAYSTGISHVFVATNCRKVTEPKLDEAERVRVVEVTLEVFMNQLRAGDLTDVGGAWQALDHLGIR